MTDLIKAVEKAYAAKDYRGTMDEIAYLSTKVQKLKSDEDIKLLPEALEGWEKKVESQSGAMGMFGGGGANTTSINAKYTHEIEKVTIKILANSPMI